VIQLSVQIEGAQGLTWPIWQTFVSEVEAMGFAGLYCCDHFANPAPPDYASLEVMTAMAYAASHSERMLLGTLVAPVSWRDPVMLARQAMAIDDLSGGRFVLGVGAGWNQREHAMFGYPLGEIPERMARFTEALEVMTRLIRSDEPQTFEGKFYQLREAALLPHPQRQTPVMVGGSGPKRTLPLVARYANIWNAGGMTPDEVRERNALLDDLIVKQGRAPGDVKRTMMKAIFCGRDEAEFEARLRGPRRNLANADVPTGELLDGLRTRTKAIIGTPDEVVAQIRAYGEAGIEEIMAQFLVVDDFDGLRILAEEVLPRLR
jgi:alkanesulfonate monooxygenase SsuD/methylene tetrahydromethanopterin reductase-like flavin-dependent oxidoreductase (luciferase family)